MTIQYKHIVIFALTGELLDRIKNYMDWIATYTKVAPPHLKLVPHVTFHRPIAGIDEQRLVKTVSGMTDLMYQTRMRYSGLDCFGKNFIVLPIHATQPAAALWASITTLVSTFPGYAHGPYDHDNTLHVSLAGGICKTFDAAWPHIKKIEVEPRDILVDSLEIHRKPIEGGSWELLQAFPLSPRPNPTP